MLNNFVDALGNVIFSNYSHDHSGNWTNSYASVLVESGETINNVEAEAFFDDHGLSGFFTKSSGFGTEVEGGEIITNVEAEAFFDGHDLSGLFTKSSGFGTEVAFGGSVASEAQIVAGFSVEAGETFSFDFLGEDFLLKAKEIENPNAEYNHAQLNTQFLLLDTSDRNNIKILDYFELGASLTSSEQIGSLEVDFSNHFTLNDNNPIIDLGGNNEIDFISTTFLGTYQRTFDNDTNLTLLKVSQSAVQWLGDPLIGKLASNFAYGTIRDDRWVGTSKDDKFYAGLGDDLLFGGNGNDTIYAGYGNDTVYGDHTVYGENGDDDEPLKLSHTKKTNLRYFDDDDDDDDDDDGKLFGDDHRKNGDDLLVGGEGEDTFYIEKDDLVVGGGLFTPASYTAFNKSLKDDPLKLSNTQKTNLGYFDGDADNFIFLDDRNGYTATIVGYESIDKLDLSAFGVTSAGDFLDSQKKDGGLWWEYKTPKSSFDAEVVLRIDAPPNQLSFL
jgi:hypothetical protein